MKKATIVIGISLALAGILWLATMPEKHFIIAPSVAMETPVTTIDVTAAENSLAELVEHLPSDLPGYDDFIPLKGGKTALVSSIDGWIWHVDLTTGAAERFADAPLMPAGLHAVPENVDQLYLCSSHFMGETYPDDEKVGLFRLDILSKKFTPIVLNVPSKTPALSGYETDAIVYSDDSTAPEINQASAGDDSRPLAFCNDLEVSEDGRRIYFTEPFSYEGASMGGGAIGEAITLGGNGRLWRHDLDSGKTTLIAQGFNFIDGILTEPSADGGREQSVLVSQTSSFGITRFYLNGPRAGQHAYLWQGLTAMPDGLDRDSEGRIWSGTIKCRSKSTTWIHANAWIKPLLLRLPHSMIPVANCTGIMAFSPDASDALYVGEIKDPVINAIASAIEHDGYIYLTNVGSKQQGLIRIKVSALLKN